MSHQPPPPPPSPAPRRAPILVAGAFLALVGAGLVAFFVVFGGGDESAAWLGTDWETEIIDGAIVGGPGNPLVAHPSGRIAFADGDQICMADVSDASSARCRPLGWRRVGRFAGSWSPDARYLTLTESFLVLFAEPDIWVWDVEEDTLVDVTDDGAAGPRGRTEADTDVFPVFVADGEIAFLRVVDDDERMASLWTIRPDGTDLREVAPDLLPLSAFAGRRLLAHPVAAERRWHILAADGDGAGLEIVTVDLAGGEVSRTALTGDVTGEDGLVAAADPAGWFSASSMACSELGADHESCRHHLVDPETATVVVAPPFEGNGGGEEPIPSPFPLTLSPDGTAVAGCFPVRGASGVELTSRIALADLDEPEWTVIAEFDASEVGTCGGTLAWTEGGIAVPLFPNDLHLFLRPAG